MSLTAEDIQSLLGYDEKEAKKSISNARLAATLEKVVAETKKYASFPADGNVAKRLRKLVMSMPKKDTLPLPGMLCYVMLRYVMVCVYVLVSITCLDLFFCSYVKALQTQAKAQARVHGMKFY